MMSFVKKAVVATALTGAAAHAGAADTKAEPTIVLVHGAFADGSTWNNVIPLLQAKGLKVLAVQNPLTSLVDDVATTRRALDSQTGPVVLVGHSYGGAVITQAGNDPHVQALVYVAAFAPDEGQSVADLNKAYTTPAGFSEIVADAAGFLTLSPAGVAKYLAQDVPADRAAIMGATQGPIRGANFEEKISNSAWKTKPSWYVVASDDHMLDADLQQAMAKNIGAKVTTLSSSHVPHISHPAKVADVILDAVAQTVK